MEIPYKIYLDEEDLPKAWYNLRADMVNKPAPLLHPETHKPMTYADLEGVFCEELIRQELDEANQKLRDRTIRLEEAGSLAEAALLLNGVFEAAQAACQQYEENLRMRCQAPEEPKKPSKRASKRRKKR